MSHHQFFYHPSPSEDIHSHHDLRDLVGHSLTSQSSPRIEITCSELHHHNREHVPTAPMDISRRLAVPLYQSQAYRENLSPVSSNSSGHSEIYSPQPSPCASPIGGVGVLSTMTVAELCPRLQAIHASGSPHTSPTNSPRTSITEETFLNCRPSSASNSRPGSRSTSPQGKRTYEQYQNPSVMVPRSRSPSPHSAREEQAEPCRPTANLDDFADSRHLAKPVPTKIGRPNQVYSQSEQGIFSEVKRESVMEQIYVMPSLSWPSQMPTGMCR